MSFILPLIDRLEQEFALIVSIRFDAGFPEPEVLAELEQRRVVLVVKERPDDLFLDYFFLLTNWSVEEMPAKNLLDFYRKRGTAENYYGELINVLKPALSCTTRQK